MSKIENDLKPHSDWSEEQAITLAMFAEAAQRRYAQVLEHYCSEVANGDPVEIARWDLATLVKADTARALCLTLYTQGRRRASEAALGYLRAGEPGDRTARAIADYRSETAGRFLADVRTYLGLPA